MDHSSKFFPCLSLLLSLFLGGCTERFAAFREDRSDNSVILRDLREEIADLKHSLSNTQVELQILEEQYKMQESSYKKVPGSGQDPKISGLEKKISLLSNHANETTQCLSDCNTKIAQLQKSIEQQNTLLNELVRIKSGLTSLSGAVSTGRIHHVRAGESLEKIAKLYGVSVTEIKEENHLTGNKILIGQELRIPSGSDR